MGLKVWLPLNGDLENLGTSNITFSGTPTWRNSGKIGNSAYNLSARVNFNCPSLADIKCFSIAFWGMIEANADSTANWMDVLSFTDKSTGGTIGYFRFETGYGSTAYGGIHWHDNTTNAIISGSYTYNNASEYGKWHHIVVTVSETALCSYYDGELKSTLTANLGGGSLTGAGWIGESTTRGGIQDIRVYDHCLSAAEVKEISQGLVLHYKLDGNYGLTDLYPTHTHEPIVYNNQGNTKLPTTKTYLNETFQGDQVCRITYTPTDDSIAQVRGGGLSARGIYYGQFGPYLANTKYVFWCYYRINSGHTDTRVGGTASNIGGWFEIPPTYIGNGWYRVGQYRDGTVTENKKSENIFESFYTPSAQVGETIVIDWASPHLLQGTTEIPSNDSFLGNDIVQDSSGYENNGTIIGNLLANSSTPKYSNSIKFTDSASSIGLGNLSTLLPEKIFTFNIWFKKITGEWSTKTWETILGGPSGFELEGKLSNTTNAYIHPYSWGGGSTTTPNSYSIEYTLDEWHMLTMVRTTSNTKFYLDGELKVTGSAGSIPSGDYFIGAWKTATQQNYRGLFSDARIYCTALLDTDIKQLYNTSMKIDNYGNSHLFQLDEINGNQILPANCTKTATVTSFSYEPQTDTYTLIIPDNSNGTTGAGISLGSSHKLYFPWNKSYRLSMEVYSPVSGNFFIDYNNAADDTSGMSGNDNDVIANRISSKTIQANTWTQINFGTTNANETKNPNHRTLYDYSYFGLLNKSGSAVTYYIRNIRWYLVDDIHKLYQTGTFRDNQFVENSIRNKTSLRNEEKCLEASNFIEK